MGTMRMRLLTAAVLCVAAGGCGQGHQAGACRNTSKEQGRVAVYAATTSSGARPSRSVVERTAEILCERVRAAAIKGVGIRRLAREQIELNFPTATLPRSELVTRPGALAFYGWEPNLYLDLNGKVTTLGNLELANPQHGLQLAANSGAGALPLLQAVQLASKLKPTPEADDVPPGGPSKAIAARFHNNQRLIQTYYDQRNDTAGDKYYLFGPASKGGQRQLIRPGEVKAGEGGASQANDASAYYGSCAEIASDFSRTGVACPAARIGRGPLPRSIVVKVPRGIVVIKKQQVPQAAKTLELGYYVLEDDTELSGSDIRDPKQASDPQTSEPIVTFQFTDAGRKAFARATKREAKRGQNLLAPGASGQAKEQRLAISLDNQIVALATISFMDYPEGISGETGAQINSIGSIQETQDLAATLRTGPLPVRLTLVRISGR